VITRRRFIQVYRVGWISATPEGFAEPYAQAFVRRLGELGLVEGRNLTIERRHGGNSIEKLPVAAAELAKLNCDAFFTAGSEAGLAALTQSSRTTPIVLVAVDFDPVATGDVASLARPGGRVTGVTAIQSELPAKRVEILRELLPRMAKVAVLANEQTAAQLALVQGTARRLGLALHVVDLKRPPFDFDAAFAEMVRNKADALFVLGSGFWVPARRRIPQLALNVRLPTMFHHAQWAEEGGLISYGFNFSAMWSRGAEMMAKVLRGAAPGTMPMEQPTSFELVVNASSAKVLGVKVPQSILLRADRVIS
jgi:putative ABC transport system substrate-binding protein